MDDETAMAALMTMMRDQARRTAPALAENCDHDLQELPIIDCYVDKWCGRCGGMSTEIPA